jgi:hypothetical protein
MKIKFKFKTWSLLNSKSKSIQGHRSAIGDGATHLPAAPHAHPTKRYVCWRCGCCERRL